MLEHVSRGGTDARAGRLSFKLQEPTTPGSTCSNTHKSMITSYRHALVLSPKFCNLTTTAMKSTLPLLVLASAIPTVLAADIVGQVDLWWAYCTKDVVRGPPRACFSVAPTTHITITGQNYQDYRSPDGTSKSNTYNTSRIE